MIKQKHIPPTHEYRGKQYKILEVVPHKKAVAIEKKRLLEQGVQICSVDGREDFGGYLIYARMNK
jgi:hypothetical protein